MQEQQSHNRLLAFWLFLCCTMIFGMVVLGGLTRLTGSGLSMVEWDPIFGVVPPLNETQWQNVFQKYQQSPEFQKINAGMDLPGFKSIYWFEFIHRLFGRTIGVVFLLPFLYFLWRGWVRRSLVPRLVLMFVLGGLQGLLGWYMVKSGLVDNPHVSQYRLTAHFLTAVVIYGYIFWVGLDLYYNRSDHRRHPSLRLALPLLALIFLTMGSGGLVAGLKAGLAYNTFPLMNGHLIPEGFGMLHPLWKNFFENIATVQFDHRLLATVTFTLVLLTWFFTRRRATTARARISLNLLAVMVLIQVSLGISTLLLHVPIPLASAHQAGALILFTLMIYHVHALSQVAES